jgi:hypothetical protein
VLFRHVVLLVPLGLLALGQVDGDFRCHFYFSLLLGVASGVALAGADVRCIAHTAPLTVACLTPVAGERNHSHRSTVLIASTATGALLMRLAAPTTVPV